MTAALLWRLLVRPFLKGDRGSTQRNPGRPWD
jgi:hypothetical protein